ncbi:unnamed protein product [Notodromas monacha]|uniref:Uncharacterized protein n=1 Tax=Notodromas monacha TaxID=399045 RepID=A0A7R9GJW4_9CRUS|nr:unnamed protein product [Notodromas monacha]CAG0924100.1 unnamed protein product [Notodromas monacha]
MWPKQVDLCQGTECKKFFQRKSSTTHYSHEYLNSTTWTPSSPAVTPTAIPHEERPKTKLAATSKNEKDNKRKETSSTSIGKSVKMKAVPREPEDYFAYVDDEDASSAGSSVTIEDFDENVDDIIPDFMNPDFHALTKRNLSQLQSMVMNAALHKNSAIKSYMKEMDAYSKEGQDGGLIVLFDKHALENAVKNPGVDLQDGGQLLMELINVVKYMIIVMVK